MINVKDHKSGDLWEQWRWLGPKRKALLERGWPGLFRNLLLPKLPVQRLAKGFDRSNGRPSKELYAAMGAVLLQQMHDLTDEQTVSAFSFDLRWHYALDVSDESDDGKYMSEKTLRNYRKAMTEDEGMAEQLFGELTDQMLSEFGVETGKQRQDSTHIVSNMKRLNRVGLFVATISAFLRNLRRQASELFAARISNELADRYLGREKSGCFSRVKPSGAERALQDLADDLLYLVRLFCADDEVKRMNSYKALERLLGEQCDVDGDGGDKSVKVKPGGSVPADSMQNPSDPDATYSRVKGAGYSVQIMETHDTPAEEEREEAEVLDLVTHVSVRPCHEHDSSALVPALEETAGRGYAPGELVADAAYGSDDNLLDAAAKGVKLVSPVPGGARGRSTALRSFEFDDDSGEVLRCPGGREPSGVGTPGRRGKYTATFDADTCRHCAELKRCPVRLRGCSALLSYTAKDHRLARRRAREESEEFRQEYRWRAGIEGSISRFKGQTGVGRLRVRGFRRVSFAVKLKALGFNILRAARLWAARGRAEGPLKGPIEAAWWRISAIIRQISQYYLPVPALAEG